MRQAGSQKVTKRPNAERGIGRDASGPTILQGVPHQRGPVAALSGCLVVEPAGVVLQGTKKHEWIHSVQTVFDILLKIFKHKILQEAAYFLTHRTKNQEAQGCTGMTIVLRFHSSVATLGSVNLFFVGENVIAIAPIL